MIARLAPQLAEVVPARRRLLGPDEEPAVRARLGEHGEARITLGVVAAGQGDLEQAVTYGEWALKGDRQSLPPLLMVSREPAAIVNRDFADEATGREYLDHLTTLGRAG
ncbi:hypothetical protein [Streptomyces sp. NPDC086835]|uniref:hypothetical protein n=1 Tax=Streptomyces sp. NPDC086835 TaxID=3365761 RepID=UPI0038289050